MFRPLCGLRTWVIEKSIKSPPVAFASETPYCKAFFDAPERSVGARKCLASAPAQVDRSAFGPTVTNWTRRFPERCFCDGA